MARKPSGRPWLHGASGWWCTTINKKRKKLDKDYRVACRKPKALRTQQKWEEAGDREWLGAPFSVLADEYLADTKARKKPPTYVSRRHRLLGALRILGTRLRVGELRKFHSAKIEQETSTKDYSPTTIKDTIAAVQGAFNWAVPRTCSIRTRWPAIRSPEPGGEPGSSRPRSFGASCDTPTPTSAGS